MEKDRGRMSIMDTRPFMLPAVRHKTFGQRLRVTGIQAWLAAAVGYRKSRYTP